MRTLAKLAWTEVKLFFREPFTVIFVLAFPLVVLVVLGGVFGEHPDPDFRGASGVDFYLASYVGVVIGAIGLMGLPVHLAGYRERGILRRFEASSVPTWKVLGAQIAVSFGMAAAGALLLVVAAPLIYDVHLPSAIGQVTLAFTVGALSFLALGVLLGVLFRTARAAQAVGLALFFPMWLLSGAGPPPSVMTSTMRQVSEALPLTHVVNALQDPWLGRGSNPGELLLLTGILVVAGGLSLIRRSAR